MCVSSVDMFGEKWRSLWLWMVVVGGEFWYGRKEVIGEVWSWVLSFCGRGREREVACGGGGSLLLGSMVYL